MLFLGEEYQIKVHFHSHHAGFYEQLLVFEFETWQQPSDKFKIMRLLEVIHQTSSTEQLLLRAKKTARHLPIVRWTPAQWYNKLISCDIHVFYISVLIMLYNIARGIVQHSCFCNLFRV